MAVGMRGALLRDAHTDMMGVRKPVMNYGGHGCAQGVSSYASTRWLKRLIFVQVQFFPLHRLDTSTTAHKRVDFGAPTRAGSQKQGRNNAGAG